jgi:GWxTD domain-containing protein
MRTKSLRLALLLVVLTCAIRAEASNATRARALYDRAMRRSTHGTPEEVHYALGELEQAALLDPNRHEYALAAGRLCLQGDMLHQARHWAERALEQDSSDAEAHLLMGRVWRQDWLIDPDPLVLQRAVVELCRAARTQPSLTEAWSTLVPLLVEIGEIEGARGAAEMAWETDSSRVEAWLERAYTVERTGDLEQAASLFEQALARLPRGARERFDDVSLLLPRPDALDAANPAERAEFNRRFWDDNDPDLVTPYNEARLEFLARATHAYLLYFRPALGTWDTRGDLYVRYGPPRWMVRNPEAILNYVDISRLTMLQWGYPDLGMRVWMIAVDPLGSYRLPIAYGGAIPHAFPDSLASRPELMPVGYGWAVFPRIPPGTHPIPLDCALARFEGDVERRLLAHAECPGGPGDSLHLEWAVLDASRQERARASRWMATSACAPGETRAGSFTADLPAGEYRVGVSVHDEHGGRGVFTGAAAIGPPDEALGISDVVVTCGQPQTSFLAGSALRLEVNPGAKVRSRDKLTAYFEIYHLTPGTNGWSRFEYVYTVRSIEKDRRVWLARVMSPRKLPPPVEATREEETAGAVRRQFVTVPIQSLPSGRYEIEIRVRDLNSGARAAGTAQFFREES